MPYYQSTYHSRIYRDFKEIESTAYRKIIHFYEKREPVIRQLDFDEYFELLTAYVESLFEVGSYQKHLLMVDVVIELSIRHNIQYRNGEDIYQRMLFKKAASLYNILEYDRADYILRELIRIDPYDKDAVLFLKKCLRRKRPPLVIQSRAAGMFLFLLTGFIICLELLLVRNFYSAYTGWVENFRTSVFLLGCVVLVVGDLFYRWSVEREVNRYVAGARQIKRY